MDRDGRLSLVVGGFVVVTLASLALVILTLSADSSLFQSRYRLIAQFDNVAGLLPNAPVWLAGKEVGRVESVDFSPLGDQHPLLVTIQVDDAVRDRIRADSVASIGTIGVLGDSYIEIASGTAAAEVLEEGGEIQTLTPANIGVVIGKGAQALDNIATLAKNLNSVAESFGSERGGERAAEAVSAVTDIMLEVQTGQGLLHSLVYDQYQGGGVESIQRSLASLEDILIEVRSGKGIMHSLIYEETTDQDVIVEALESGARLNSILAKVDRGEGSLGLLVNDPSLYEDLKILLGGAQRSLVLRTLIRLAVDSEQ